MILNVGLGERAYDIVIERGCLAKASALCNLDRKVLVVTDSGVPLEYAHAVADQCAEAHLAIVAQGEQSKSLEVFGRLLQTMIEAQFTRGDCVVAVGGGIVGDLAGFVAASYMRGVDFYNIPTTVLAQVDSSIGGKTAINLGGYKNMVGAFYQPRKVLIDLDVLHTLPRRQIANGLAEAVKMALTSDAQLFGLFEEAAAAGGFTADAGAGATGAASTTGEGAGATNATGTSASAGAMGAAGAAHIGAGAGATGAANALDGTADDATNPNASNTASGTDAVYAALEPHLETIIERSLRVKKHVVEQDEREAGLRKILNFGHTIGHGVESYEQALYGEPNADASASTGNVAFAADACAAPAFAADASASDTTFAPTDGREQGLYHGECVALGMIPLCTAPVRARLVPVLRALGLPTTRAFDAAAVTQAIKHDKKSSQSGVTIITVPEIGTYTTEQTTAEALGKLLPLIQKKKV